MRHHLCAGNVAHGSLYLPLLLRVGHDFRDELDFLEFAATIRIDASPYE